MKVLRIGNLVLGEGRPKICVPISERGETEIFAAAREIAASCADLAEWRADWFCDLNDPDVVAKVILKLKEIIAPRPLLFTIRTKSEGGEAEVSPAEYRELNLRAADAGAQLIDVEIFSRPLGSCSPLDNVRDLVRHGAAQLVGELHRRGASIVGSTHDFKRAPCEKILLDAIAEMQNIGVDVCKAALMPSSPTEVLSLLCSARRAFDSFADRPMIVVAMGRLGVVSRIAGELIGSCLTFATVGKASAPGQIPARQMAEYLSLFGPEIKY